MSRKKSYPVRIPRVACGIRAQETRSGVNRVWWARKWMEILESMGLSGRLGRGKSYALSGQVTEFVIRASRVEATVVGTRPDPYTITIDFRVPDPESRKRIIAAIKAEPMYIARLLVDDLPQEIEDFFAKEGYTLFPGGKIAPRVYDMTTKCSCPDYANPCKHTTAALIILGEEIARRPMTLLECRGITMKDLGYGD